MSRKRCQKCRSYLKDDRTSEEILNDKKPEWVCRMIVCPLRNKRGLQNNTLSSKRDGEEK